MCAMMAKYLPETDQQSGQREELTEGVAGEMSGGPDMVGKGGGAGKSGRRKVLKVFARMQT